MHSNYILLQKVFEVFLWKNESPNTVSVWKSRAQRGQRASLCPCCVLYGARHVVSAVAVPAAPGLASTS